MTTHASVPEPSAELVEVTPHLARKWLRHNVGNRAMKDRKTSLYARDMAAGDWLVTGDGPKFDTGGRLINGQHTLEAVIAADVPVSMFVFAGMDRDAQKVMDTGVKRSAADALKMEGITGCRLTTLAAVSRIALGWDDGAYSNTTQSRRIDEVSNSQAIEWVYENPDAIAAVQKSSLMASLLPPASIVAFSYLMLSRVDSEDADEFFAAIINLRTAGQGDPIAALIKRHQGSIKRGEKLSHHQHLGLLFRTWNAWRAGATLTHLKTGMTGGVAIRIPEPK